MKTMNYKLFFFLCCRFPRGSRWWGGKHGGQPQPIGGGRRGLGPRWFGRGWQLQPPSVYAAVQRRWARGESGCLAEQDENMWRWKWSEGLLTQHSLGETHNMDRAPVKRAFRSLRNPTQTLVCSGLINLCWCNYTLFKKNKKNILCESRMNLPVLHS